MTDRLYNTLTAFDDDIFRNITERHIEPGDPFDDLTEGEESLADTAHLVEKRVRRHRGHGEPGVIEPLPTHLNIINVPFERDTFFPTRYSDGSFAAWYGSIEPATTVYETAYHMIRAELALEGMDHPVVRERSIYQVHCNALAIDLRGKQDEFPQLISNSYDFTHQIGARLKQEGHPAAVVPSARCKGDNVVVFNRIVLANPRHHTHLQYVFDPEQITVTVHGLPNQSELIVSGHQWF
ncbi:hypothetical protein DSCO28_14340 [Desulfosarcina ovata subsp. sediminis]|uniref:RES domain-containing protein n=1 Tax=Desulfosarcina ovata subsp. sediminis TaxID=885957 RepID=A0A5K7ZFD0_9BACT|nr:RES family NAD+ phosphorylase [Desulfosarcina ovata]BBO80868.1 hypothetical protein DSCO28_14340 [Desulfosarcina ovata subsp. sediminis]